MKKAQIGMLLFWLAVVSLKVWSSLNGQTSAAERATEIAGFLAVLLGSLACVFYARLNRRQFEKWGREAARQIVDVNFFALLSQGLLLIVAGTLMLFLKWEIAVVVGALFLIAVAALFFYGWPHIRVRNRDSGFRKITGMTSVYEK